MKIIEYFLIVLLVLAFYDIIEIALNNRKAYENNNKTKKF